MFTIDEKTLRERFATATPDEWLTLARNHELEYWRDTNQFCGKCGAPMRPHTNPNERAMQCPKCGFLAYPTLTPAVIVLIRKGDQILLQRNAHYKLPHWTLVAGFVEPAETLEQTCQREAREEASIEIGNVRYVASQIWPFPSNIMIGFVADWVDGEIHPDGDEVLESAWFSRDNLPSIPSKVSIARRLIDMWINREI